MKQKLLLFALIPGLILAYGYWHSITHGSVYIGLEFKAPDETKHAFLSKAEVLFMDVNDNVLAKGIRDKERNYVHLIHPQAGDCHELANISRQLWPECFKIQSVWIPTWVGDVSQVQIKHENCFSRKIPIVFSEGNSGWLLWWVPLPHVGGKPYSYFTLSIVVEANDCLNQSVE